MTPDAIDFALQAKGREVGWADPPEPNCGKQAHWDRIPRRQDPIQAEVCCRCYRIRRRRGS